LILLPLKITSLQFFINRAFNLLILTFDDKERVVDNNVNAVIFYFLS